MALTAKEEKELLRLIKDEEDYFKYNKLDVYFGEEDYIPMKGKPILSKASYSKHWNFIRAGAVYKERFFCGGNRSGKTTVANWEVAVHLTGRYPKNWPGKKFTGPISAYLLGKTNESTRDVLQKGLLGDFREAGTGMIPKDDIIELKPRPNIPNGIGYVRVKHYDLNGKYDGDSEINFRSYQQGEDPLMGIKCHIIHFDEEPPEMVYSEGIIRTMDLEGIVIMTFTPLEGWSNVVRSMLPGGKFPKYDENLKYLPINDKFSDFNKYVANITWDDAPHLSEEEKKFQWDACPPYLRNARAKGQPVAGVARIYPIDEEDFVVKPFDIPVHWPRCAGLDVGWKRTAAVWGAIDPNTQIMYIYSEYVRGQAEAPIHSTAIKMRDTVIEGVRPAKSWIPIAIDTGSHGRSQADGQQLFNQYEDHGLYLINANKAIESGIFMCYQRLSVGKTKIFSTMEGLVSEILSYQYDKHGNIGQNQLKDLCDAYRYLEMTSRECAETFDAKLRDHDTTVWYNSNSVTGY